MGVSKANDRNPLLRVWVSKESKLKPAHLFIALVAIGAFTFVGLQHAQRTKRTVLESPTTVAISQEPAAPTLFLAERAPLSFMVLPGWTSNGRSEQPIHYTIVLASISNQPDPEWRPDPPGARNLDTLADASPIGTVYIEVFIQEPPSSGRTPHFIESTQSSGSESPFATYVFPEQPANMAFTRTFKGRDYQFHLVAPKYTKMKNWKEACDILRSFNFTPIPAWHPNQAELSQRGSSFSSLDQCEHQIDLGTR